MDHILPNSSFYLVHPSVDELIHEYNGSSYAKNFNKDNIVGDGYPWFDRDIFRYAVKADIVKFSEIMANAEFSTVYQGFLRNWIVDISADLLHCDYGGGDSLVMVDASPLALLNACARLAIKINSFAPFPRQVRFGGSAGIITFENDEPSGQALRTAARLEPRTQANYIMFDDRFYEGLRLLQERSHIRKIALSDRSDIANDGVKFDLRKNDTDLSVLTNLWEVDLINSQFSSDLGGG